MSANPMARDEAVRFLDRIITEYVQGRENRDKARTALTALRSGGGDGMDAVALQKGLATAGFSVPVFALREAIATLPHPQPARGEAVAEANAEESFADRLVNDYEDAAMRRCQQFCPAVERSVTGRPHRDAIAARAALIAAISTPPAAQPAEADRHGADALAWMRAQAKARGMENAETETPLYLARFLGAQPAEAGKVRLPVDASDAMVQAALAVDFNNEDEAATMHNIWHAMTAAALAEQARGAQE